MLQVTALKQLYASEKTLLAVAKEINQSTSSEQDWYAQSGGGLQGSFNWVFGHYAAVEDWFLWTLNHGKERQLPDHWHDIYWSDFGAVGVKPERSDSFNPETVVARFKETRKRLYIALATDALHLKRCVPNAQPGQPSFPSSYKLKYFPEMVKFRGDAWAFIAGHSYWHIGQVMALRAQLGWKPL